MRRLARRLALSVTLFAAACDTPVATTDGGVHADARAAVDARLPDGAAVDAFVASGPDNPFEGLPMIVDIDTAVTAPDDQVGTSEVVSVLGHQARHLPVGDQPTRMAYRIRSDQLVAGHTYVLEVEYPDDVPRAFFMSNRGADFTRGWATGTATGDARLQFVAPSVESLAYPQSGNWERYQQLFMMHEHLQAIPNIRDCHGCRAETPADGFWVFFFQTWQSNDPRNQGTVVGHIRLYEVPDPTTLRATIHRPPAELPQRYVFWREEMADGAISASAGVDRAFDDPLDWYRSKLMLAGAYGIDTYARDLLEFGYNQGWESGDVSWVNDAQAPLTDIWPRIVDLASSQGFSVVPYYEYRGSIGWTPTGASGLGPQRRAHKLYDGVLETCGNLSWYTCIYWTEDANVDLTDPDTRADFFRMLDVTVGHDAASAHVPAIWIRTRYGHLPISFAPATIARFVADRPADAGTTVAMLRTSYEGDMALYRRYFDWWDAQRASFLSALRDHARSIAGNDLEVIFTPWITEQIPTVIQPDNSHAPVGVITDDPAWFNTYAATFDDSTWLRWAWVPRTLDEVASNDFYGQSLRWEPHAMAGGDTSEVLHAAPNADPATYASIEGVLPSYPLGRYITVANPATIQAFHVASGTAAVHHFTLNETNGDVWATQDAAGRQQQPFGDVAGYVAVDVDRAGPVVMLEEARSIAYGDPRVLAWLSASSFSTGFPMTVRRFYQAYLAVPALPSTAVAAASDNAAIVVREITTPSNGTYYYVVNTSWSAQSGHVDLPASGTIHDIVGESDLGDSAFPISLAPAELRAYHVGG